MKLRLLSTQTDSQTAKLLAKTLTEILGYRVWRSDTIMSFAVHVQYGDPRTKDWQYEWMQKRNLPGPEFTYSIAKAIEWKNAGNTIIARQMINSQDGGGIIVVKPTDNLPDAKVYTKYFPATAEFRVMLFQDKVLQIFEKRRKHGFPKNILKTTGNGYVLCSSNVNIPPGMETLAQQFCYINRSDIKGIDIAYDENTKKMMVLEINSAPEMGPIMCKKVAQLILDTYPEELVI